LLFHRECLNSTHSTTPRFVSRRNDEQETERIFAYRAVDRRGDHFDHRGYRHSQPASRQDCREPGFGSRSLRTISSAEETFSATFSDGYTLTMAQLGGPAGSQGCKNAGLIDEVLSVAPNQKSGYGFTFTPNGTLSLTAGVPAACGVSGNTGFSVSATPVTLNSTGTTAYCVDETGVVRVNAGGVVIAPPCAGSGFPPLQ
jgi:hypothetical protein